MSNRTRKKTPWLKLVVTAASTQGLYFMMARLASEAHTTRLQLFEETPLFFVIWAGLILLFAIAMRTVKNAAGRGVTIFIFLTSFSFRATLIPAAGFQTETPTEWITEPGASPLGRAARAVSNELRELAASWGFPPESALPIKILSTGADLAALALLPALLNAAGLSSTLTVAYGWNPLAIKESAASGRLLSLGLLLLALGIRACQKRSRLKAAVAYGLSLTGGLWTAACAPIMARFLRASTFIAAVVGLVAWAEIGISDIDFSPASYIGSSLLPVTVSLARVFLTRNPLYPTIACISAWLFVVLFRAVRRPLEPEELPRETLFAVGGLLMVLPQVFPWYFIPLAFLSAFSRNRGWLVLAATAPLTYLAHGGGGWKGWSFWLGFAQYFPAYSMLIFDWLGKERSKQ